MIDIRDYYRRRSASYTYKLQFERRRRSGSMQVVAEYDQDVPMDDRRSTAASWTTRYCLAMNMENREPRRCNIRLDRGPSVGCDQYILQRLKVKEVYSVTTLEYPASIFIYMFIRTSAVVYRYVPTYTRRVLQTHLFVYSYLHFIFVSNFIIMFYYDILMCILLILFCILNCFNIQVTDHMSGHDFVWTSSTSPCPHVSVFLLTCKCLCKNKKLWNK